MSEFTEKQLAEINKLIKMKIDPLLEQISKLKTELQNLKPKPLFSSFFDKNNKLDKNESNIINAIHAETRYQENKQKNIIIYNVAESTKVDSADKIKDDFGEVTKILTQLNCTTTIKKVHRFPKITSNKTTPPTIYPGALCVELDSKNATLSILKANKSLLANSAYSNVFIKADLTASQLEHHKKLVMERNNKNNDRSNDDKAKFYYGIRNFEIKKINIKFSRH
jgi:hypothetical protein